MPFIFLSRVAYDLFNTILWPDYLCYKSNKVCDKISKVNEPLKSLQVKNHVKILKTTTQ